MLTGKTSCDRVKEQPFFGTRSAEGVLHLSSAAGKALSKENIEIFYISLAINLRNVPNLQATMHNFFLVVVARLRGSIPKPLSCQVTGHSLCR